MSGMALLSLIVLICSVESLIIRIPSELNRMGAIIFNASLDSSRIYTLSPRLTPPFASHFVDVSTQDGLVFLRRQLVCSSDSLSNVVPYPLTVYIESHSFRIGGSQTKLIIIPLNIYFAHHSCPSYKSYKRLSSYNQLSSYSRLSSYSNSHSDNNTPSSRWSTIHALVVLNDDSLCIKRSQFLAHLPNFIPHSIKSKCNINFDARIDNKESVLKYSVEQKSSDLVSLSEVCISCTQFNASVALLIDCKTTKRYNRHKTKESIEPLVKGDNEETLELTFHMRDADVDEFLENIRLNYKTRSSFSRTRREMTNSQPIFDKSLYIVNVPEEKDKGYIVTTLSATDPESTELLYSMSAVLDARSQSMFSIDSISGVITTTSRLDREFMDVHYLRITAVDSGIPPRTGTTTLQINVNDDNDHSPAFEQASYEASIRESSPIATTVVTVRATDQDSGPNADIEYSILNPTGPNEAFRIDSHSGIITTRASLDRESVDFYSLTVQASDSGPVQLRRHSQTTVSLRILDDNDNYPQFSERSYSVQVPEDINWLNNPVIMKVNAKDSDEGLNAAVRYSIIGGNTQGIFQMDSMNGEVSVISPLDYETFHSYRLVLRAQDAGSPPRSNTTQLLINVLDKNDNEPKFYTSLFQETVMENVAIGNSIVRVQAYDADDGLNSAISYQIKNANKPDMPISIDNQTGWIMTTRELDWEESNLYEFIVVAQDNGSPVLSSTANVIIRVQDLNDNSPVFEPKLYEAQVSEIDTPGSPVISVTASDRDENSRLIFQISSGNSRGRFNIISQNGIGLVSIAQPLDYKAEKKFVLTVTATDSGGRSDTATVYINVTDANTHRPVIERTPYAVSIPEDTPIGSTILVIEATDADVGENARITFQMDDVPEFRIDHSSGAIVTTKSLDREQTAGYTIVVTAIDNGIPPLADITNVEIEIADVNDNSPEFKQSVYTTAISEDAPIGSSVVQISAFDKDLGLNGQVRYTFSGGNDGSNTFVIDPTSGIIRTNKVLDRETTPKYDLMAYVYDRGTPAMSSTVIINVFVEDCNDNPPRFASERIQFYAPENSPIGWIVGELNAIDPDEGPNAKIEYSIVGGPDMKSFSLKSRPGDNGAELITRIEMDYESAKKKYNIIIRASSLPLRNDVDVEIHVTDVNDHAPVLRDFSIIFNNYKNHFPLNQAIGRMPAFDADVADKLKYKFLSGNNANLLILNETNGDIKLSPSLNTNVPMRALFEVSVSDGINEASATCHLIVNLVTESMLFNSVTIRLNRITQQAFLSAIFDRFLEGLAAIIPCSKENIVIFNVQDDIEVDSQILNVSFSARLPDSRDSELYFSPQFLQERVYLSRAILTKLTDLEVLPFDDNLCVREPCLNFEECLSVLKFGNASDFIASDTTLFRAISPVNTFACRCPKGFQGMHHKYECDTEINLCFSGPCLNGGICVHQEGSYVCLCSEGYAGKNCEINFLSDHCRSGLCKSDSRCVNSRSMKIKASIGIGSFHCINCSLEDWSTPLCELKTRSFTKGSYLTFSSLRQRYRLNIRLRFATRETNGLLFYNGRYNEKHDFVALEIIDSKIVFSFSVGANVSQVSVESSQGIINDGNWHQIEVNYLNRSATLKLDNCDEALLKAVERKQLGRRYVCANKTTLHLESRCADKMQTCYRFLDLTGPLQIGGLPPLPTRFQIVNSHFTGCITDLFIDHQMVDLNSYVANNGTLSGCSHKRTFCESHPCRNGGTCQDGWGSYTCNCQNSFSGEDCSHSNEVVKQFKGDGFLSFTPRLRPLSLPWLVRFQFKTVSSNGLLMKLQLGQNSIVIIEIVDAFIKYTYNSQSLTIPNAIVNDGKWHNIEANWMINGIWLNLDFGQYEQNRDLEGDIRGLYIAKVTIGGYETNDDSDEDKSPNFVGCIQGLDVGNSKDSWLRPSLENNVYEGCTSVNPCLAKPCPLNSRCVAKGMSLYECICDAGFAGDLCIPVCDLNPCALGSTCLLWNNSRGYKCQCDRLHTGIYCEDKLPETCPSNWWGYPICGPCNCDTSKGYDGNCNKTSGECNCQQNHFQPINSDICFDCDCYIVGSYTNRCDPISGQCRCRPGVIGRRCDSCPSPFAEVTLRGCEVIYEGCPRSFSEDIWWERTLFGSDAIQSCPTGSVGKAVRRCTEANGWSTPDLFECTSNAFLELSEHSVLLDKDEFPLTTYLSIKISNDLRTAINNTHTLYGNDILIAYRLIRHLISNELKQSGLNLTHKQDRHFMRNLVESTSLVLEPRYLISWDKIADIDRGPEYLLKLFNSYAETLIDNLRDTFTDPFEISTKWMIFGLDTVSTNELWDMPKSLHSYMNRSALIHSSVPSVYVDFSLPSDSSPAVSIPKYNNYPIRKQNIDDITRAVIPLKALGVKTIQDVATSPITTSFHKPYQQNALIGYTIFPSLGLLLPGIIDSTVRHRFGMPIKANSPIFALTIKPANSTKYLNKSIQPKLHFRLRTLMREGRSSPQCAYWAFTGNANSRQKTGSTYTRGRWSSKGCEIKGFHPPQKYKLAYDYINCSCDRAIGIAVLMDVTANEYYLQESLAQIIVSYTGVIISLILLAITLFMLSAIRGLETNSNTIHRNLVLCLFLAELIFLIALRIRKTLVQKEFPCKMTAIFLQYFFMCIFSWMFVESVHLYRMLTEIRDINHGPMRFYYFTGYAIPAIIVGLTVGVRADQYGNYLFCWLSIYESVIWSLVAPICIAIILNLCVFVMALQASVQIKDTVSDYGNLRTLLWLSIILLPLLGSVWILALLSVNDSLEELHYGFSLMAFISSVYIFIGYCLINHRVRHNIQIMWWRLQGKKVAYVDESLSGTRTSVASRSAPIFHNSSFDIMHRNMAICASSTTSRSTVTKTSSSPFRSDTQNPGVSGLNGVNDMNRKLHSQRHKRRTALNLAESESDSDVSYDRSLDLASSHSSDEDDNNDNRSAPQQNQINAAIQQNHNLLFGADVPLFSHSVHASDSEQVYNIGNERTSHTKWPHMNSSLSSSQASPLTEHGPFLSSRPYSRSNILAMTAGLSGNRSVGQDMDSALNQNLNNEMNSLNINQFSPPLIDRSLNASPQRTSASVSQSNDNLASNLNDNDYGYNINNIKLENNDISKADSISEIIVDEREVNDHNHERTPDPIEEEKSDICESQTVAQQSSIISRAAVIPPLIAPNLTSESEDSNDV